MLVEQTVVLDREAPKGEQLLAVSAKDVQATFDQYGAASLALPLEFWK